MLDESLYNHWFETFNNQQLESSGLQWMLVHSCNSNEVSTEVDSSINIQH